jgi:hypothetical protein
MSGTGGFAQLVLKHAAAVRTGSNRGTSWTAPLSMNETDVGRGRLRPPHVDG